MLLVEGSSETRLFRHLSDYVFGVRNFDKRKFMRVIFFFKMFNISVRFQKCNKKLRKSIVKLSLLRTGNFSWAANVLTTSTLKSSLKFNLDFQNSVKN